MEKIIENISRLFGCNKSEIHGFEKIDGGMMNESFIFSLRGEKYVYRRAGEGIEKLVDRHHEKECIEAAHRLGYDATYICMDGCEGWKLSRYVEKFRQPDYHSEEDMHTVSATLRRLHAEPFRTNFGLDPWRDVAALEVLAEEKSPGCLKGHRALRKRIGALYDATVGDGVEKCFCHGDTYKNNWMLCPDGEVILIDWEYAGTSDPGVDVGYLIIDAGYDFDTAEKFIYTYLGQEDKNKLFHFMAYSAIIAYYWFVWATYRESCGADTHGALEHWRDMAYKYSETKRKEQ